MKVVKWWSQADAKQNPSRVGRLNVSFWRPGIVGKVFLTNQGISQRKVIVSPSVCEQTPLLFLGVALPNSGPDLKVESFRPNQIERLEIWQTLEEGSAGVSPMHSGVSAAARARARCFAHSQ